MKSLQESLFDRNINKDILIKDMYKPMSEFPTNNGYGAFREFFVLSRISNWETLERDNGDWGFIIRTLLDMPVPGKNDFEGKGFWCDELKKKLRQEVRSYMRNIYDREFFVTLQKVDSKKFRVRFVAFPKTNYWPSKDPCFTEFTFVKK